MPDRFGTDLDQIREVHQDRSAAGRLAMFAVCVVTGPRFSEILSLRASDIRWIAIESPKTRAK